MFIAVILTACAVCNVHKVMRAVRVVRFKAALRVHLAVTWLTVYRQLQVIMRHWEQQLPWEPKLCVATVGFKHAVLRIVLSELDAPLE